jgi:hypothetical protein
MTRQCGRPAGDRAADGMAAGSPPDVVPRWTTGDLARLELAFPGFSFAVRRGLRGLTIEAWRDAAAGGLYAVITDDPRELWRELGTGLGDDRRAG